MNNLKPFFEALSNIKYGALEIELPNCEVKNFSSNSPNFLAHIKIKDVKMVDECLIGGDVAFGEAYINGEWESKNLADLLLFLVLNSDALEHFFHAHKIKMFFLFLQAILRKNTHSGSKKNIQFHYDLGNDFYQLWLDETMTYSSAIFYGKELDLKDAQRNKYQRILEKLSGGKTILEIGCGWGGFASEAVNKGYQVTGLTLSKEQQLLITKKGMTAYVQDFRILNKNFINSFDAISLLGSTEHITYYEGPGNMNEKSFRNYKDLFSVLKQYLKPNGKILLTSLVQCRPIWSFYDYIQSYILERHYGGYYSRTELIEKSITDNGFKINSIKDFTKDYHWISIVEPDHFGHWWIHWEEDTLKKIMYIFKGLCTDPFLLHHWLYYGMDTWLWQFGGYQKSPLTDNQVQNACANLKYFSISA